MCTLAIYFQSSRDFPVVVAANRDEFYDRPATPPRRLSDDPWIVAGLDVRAGGTWLGVNAHNLIVGVLNRRTSAPPDPLRRSRGRLCLEALGADTVGSAAARVHAQPGGAYNAFNLLVASPEAASVIGNVSGSMIETALSRGVHLLTNWELNDPECPRIAKSYRLFEDASDALREERLTHLLDRLRAILSDHSTPLDPRSQGPPNNLCVHTQNFGTRSSTILIYSAATQRIRMWHANGPPCITPYVEIDLPAPSCH